MPDVASWLHSIAITALSPGPCITVGCGCDIQTLAPSIGSRCGLAHCLAEARKSRFAGRIPAFSKIANKVFISKNQSLRPVRYYGRGQQFTGTIEQHHDPI
jgi:hypothetical protein